LSVSQPVGVASAATGASSPWHIPAFRHYLASVGVVTLAIQLQGTVVAYQVYELTKSPLRIGLVGLAEAVPFISLALLGGYFADRHDRRRVSMLMLLASCVLSLGLLASSLVGAALGPTTHTAVIYAIMAIWGVCRSFLQPARGALYAEVLPPELYARSIAIRSSCFQLAMVTGPALGGLLYAAVGPRGAYAAAALLFAGGLQQTYLIPRVRITPFAGTDKRLWSGIGEGFRYLAGDRLLLPALLIDLFAVLFGGATALLPVFANEILRVGSRGFGVLRAAPAVGALAASVWLSRRPPLSRAGPAMLWMVGGFGVATIGFGLSRDFALSVGLLLCLGVCDMVSVVVRGTLLQLRVPGHLLGRITAINQMFIGSSNELGAFESGLAARLLGTVPAVVLGGCVTLLVAASAAIGAPELRKLGALEQWTRKNPSPR